MPGLKQSGRVWNKTITAFFERAGLRSIPADHSVFINTSRSLIVALYVDDLIILARTVAEMEPLKKALSEAFEMKDLGEAKYILGISIRRDRNQRTLSIDQEHYIKELLNASGLGSNQRASTPANGYANITKAEPDEPIIDVCEYQTLVGKLNWLARASRPDIAFITQKLSQFAHKPSVRHLGELDTYFSTSLTQQSSQSSIPERSSIGLLDMQTPTTLQTKLEDQPWDTSSRLPKDQLRGAVSFSAA